MKFNCIAESSVRQTSKSQTFFHRHNECFHIRCRVSWPFIYLGHIWARKKTKIIGDRQFKLCQKFTRIKKQRVSLWHHQPSAMTQITLTHEDQSGCAVSGHYHSFASGSHVNGSNNNENAVTVEIVFASPRIIRCKQLKAKWVYFCQGLTFSFRCDNAVIVDQFIARERKKLRIFEQCTNASPSLTEAWYFRLLWIFISALIP